MFSLVFQLYVPGATLAADLSKGIAFTGAADCSNCTVFTGGVAGLPTVFNVGDVTTDEKQPNKNLYESRARPPE